MLMSDPPSALLHLGYHRPPLFFHWSLASAVTSSRLCKLRRFRWTNQSVRTRRRNGARALWDRVGGDKEPNEDESLKRSEPVNHFYFKFQPFSHLNFKAHQYYNIIKLVEKSFYLNLSLKFC